MRRFRVIVCSPLPLLLGFRHVLISPDSAEAVHGMPVSLQLVGRRLEDESALAITGVILKALSGSVNGTK